jgi:hypothetical protein
VVLPTPRLNTFNHVHPSQTGYKGQFVRNPRIVRKTGPIVSSLKISMKKKKKNINFLCVYFLCARYANSLARAVSPCPRAVSIVGAFRRPFGQAADRGQL